MSAEEALGVVLAGGASRRMGFDKSALEVAGRSLVVRTSEVLAPVCAEVVVSIQPGAGWDDDSLKPIGDLRSRAGPLAGLEAALMGEGASGRAVFLLACDLPLVGTEVVEHILSAAEHSPDSAAVVPLLAERTQPLCGLYRPRALAVAQEHLDAGRRSMHELLAALPVATVPIDEDLPFFRPDLFHNLNEPGDLEALLGASSP
ncbi:MAG: molybdenum cofactor guanylyltransferase [Thermoanaerobaculia bacterium]